MPLDSDGDPAAAAGPPPRMVRDRYRVEKTLGEGGMGEVLLALDTLLNRRVALKRLLPTGADRAKLRTAILREARRASQINDRHVAAIYDVLDLDDEVILVMEYVDGITLRERMTEPVSLDAFWDLAHQCVEGIAVAHAHGVIHRDIKPDNLMVTPDGQVKILDFGIAKRAEGAEGVTTTSTEGISRKIAGTPQYMSPEAHLGGLVDQRADIFSLGAVFYELLTATRPFDGGTYAAVVHRVLNTEPPPVSDLNPAAGPELSGVVAKMLAKDPAERFATSADLMRQLTEAREGSGHPRAPGPSPTAARAGAAAALPALPTRTRAAWLYTMFAMIAAVVAVGVWWKTVALPTLPKDRNVAILAPRTTGGGDFESYALGSIEFLSGRLQRHVETPGFQLASFTEGLDENVRTASDARKILGVNLALVPTLEQGPDVLRARLDLMDTARGRLIASRKIQVSSAEPFVFLDRIYRAAASLLRLDPHGIDASSECGIHGAGTLRFYLQGWGRLRAARTADDARKAVSDFEVACRTEPEAAMARAGLASAQLRVHLLTGDQAGLLEAEASAREAVALDSARAEPHRILARVLATEKNHAEALTEYGRASRLNPADDVACMGLARTYFRLGQPEREKETYLAAIERRPHCWQPYWWLATWYFRQGSVDESIRAYREMVRRSPDLYRGYSSLGGLLVLHGDYSPAIDTLKHSLELRPAKDAFDNLGTAYFNSGRVKEAVDAYNQSFQFGVAGYDSWLNLGDAYFWLRGRKDEARGAYAQAIRMGRDEILTRSKGGHSTDVMIPANLATVFPKLGQPDSARIYIGRALSADSANPMVDYCAALTYWQVGEKGKAMMWLEKSVHGGYPTRWLRDSPIFEEWRPIPEFRALVSEATPGTPQGASRN